MGHGVETYRKPRNGRTFRKKRPISRVTDRPVQVRELSIEEKKNKVRAELDSMGVKYHPLLGLEKLQIKLFQ